VLQGPGQGGDQGPHRSPLRAWWSGSPSTARIRGSASCGSWCGGTGSP
jgi:hypothetical protein